MVPYGGLLQTDLSHGLAICLGFWLLHSRHLCQAATATNFLSKFSNTTRMFVVKR